MAAQLPYMVAYGVLGDILEKVKAAKAPPRFTQDFLATKLNFPGGSAKAVIPLFKRLGLLGSDGTPTDLYKQFRNTNDKVSGTAMAEAMRKGYGELFARNEYAHELGEKELTGLIVEITGLKPKEIMVKRICNTFLTLRRFATFDDSVPIQLESEAGDGAQEPMHAQLLPGTRGELRLGYIINLNLPDTNDITVFNAIFASLRENLLRHIG